MLISNFKLISATVSTIHTFERAEEGSGSELKKLSASTAAAALIALLLLNSESF